MKLVSYDFGVDYELRTGVNFFVIENVKMLRDVISDFERNIEDNSGNFMLSNNATEISMKDKCMLIINPFDLNFEDSKMIKCVYDDIKRNMLDEDHMQETMNIMESLRQYVEKMLFDYDIELRNNSSLDLLKLLKLYNIMLEGEDETFLNRIILFMRAAYKLMKTHYFIFVNLGTFLDEDELELLNQECLYADSVAILLENTYNTDSNKYNLTLYDRDLCRVI